jgi:hypothetical protein
MTNWKERAQAEFENGQKLYADFVRDTDNSTLQTINKYFGLPIFLAKIGIKAKSFKFGVKGAPYALLAFIDDEYQIAEIIHHSNYGRDIEFALFRKEEYVREINNQFDLGGALWIAQHRDEYEQAGDTFPNGRAHAEYNGIWGRIEYEVREAQSTSDPS